MDNNLDIESKFKFSGELTRRKLMEYLPAMLVTNLSTLLLITVDGLVVGNLVGSDAFASISIFTPVTVFFGAIVAILSSGAAAQLSVDMGQIDHQKLLKTRCTIKTLVIIFAAAIGILQIPIIFILIRSYHLSPNMNANVWHYALGIMMSMPFGTISSITNLQMQVIGKMKELMRFSIMEGIVNLLLDLLFVGTFHMGVAGAGFGTGCATALRCIVTIIYLAKNTEIFNVGGEKPAWSEAKTILLRGLPDGAQLFMDAFVSYAMVSIILSSFGEIGGAIKGVNSFSSGIAMVLISGITGAMRPLIGFMVGANDNKGIRMLLKQGFHLVAILVGIFTVLTLLFPSALYAANGIHPIPDGGLLSLRFFVLQFIMVGFNSLFRLYFSNENVIRFSTILTIVNSLLLPVFAFVFSRFLPPAWLWMAFPLCEGLTLAGNVIYHVHLRRQTPKEEENDILDLSLSITPQDSVIASRQIRNYALEHGVKEHYAYLATLCIEEMLAYAESSHKSRDVSVQAIIRFLPEGAIVMILDDGKCIFFSEEEEQQEIVTSNYGVLKKIAKEVNYQYVLNLNYTVCKF